MNAKYLLSLPEHELEIIVKKKLDYLIAEGIVVQIGEKFRLKTQKELDKEMRKLLSE